MAELFWDGKYRDGRKVAPLRVPLPFQTVETVNESPQRLEWSLRPHPSQIRNGRR